MRQRVWRFLLTYGFWVFMTLSDPHTDLVDVRRFDAQPRGTLQPA